ncbi:Osmotically-inducible protein OsmY, contains BON domain [Variovorax sp. HW608]|uniref:BON domain-containing protein n=1 Tax=Variovorax sp. HW608 TaxID=1034889 RepID=UPI00081FC7C2|nr:BON domain-containing protein [Variovorax sp. HW608]SCK28238.1 Osmotically-inducible protein OsmY, contains BON domain [Variovorax sp. HW608]
MKSDALIRADVLAELAFDPAITSTDVGVIVREGVVTLTGSLTSYAEKRAIERAVQRVHGVRAVAVEMTVNMPSGRERTDADLASAAERALQWHVLVPDGKVRPLVENGWITLEGEVEWAYQSHAAETAVQSLVGVVGITNRISVRARFGPADIQRSIGQALLRQAYRESQHIDIAVDNAVVTLTGKVHSWAERRAAQGAAMSAPGVERVINHLLVEA